MTAIAIAASLVASVLLVCLTALRWTSMRLAHVERVRDLDEDGEIARRLTAIEDATEQRDQEIRDVRTSLAMKGLR